MTPSKGTRDRADRGGDNKQSHKAENPEWANGLRQLYKSVVDEPLPDSFKDLLSKLDDKS